MLLILQYFEVYPNLNEVISMNLNLIWAVAIYPVWKNPFYFTQIFPIVPKFYKNCFNYPNSIEAVGIYPNISDCIQMSMKLLYITQSGIKLLQATQNWMKLFHLT